RFPPIVAELCGACFELGARSSLARLGLRKWAHMLGFGGHFSTKSRRYSTTLGALRHTRASFAAQRRRRCEAVALTGLDRTVETGAVVVLARWRYLGSGYQ